MALNNPTPGEGYVTAYQISATPFVTSSNLTLGAIKEIKFNQVSRFITIKNTSAAPNVMAVGFTVNGLRPAQSNYFILSGSESFSAELRTDRLYLSGAAGTSNFQLVAGLTFIPTRMFTPLTSSNGYGGVG